MTLALPGGHAVTPTEYGANGYGNIRNVLPPGSNGTMSAFDIAQAQLFGTVPPNYADQLELYDALGTKDPNELTEADVDAVFKDGSFGVEPANIVRMYSPRPGVTIIRDTFGVPHIYGDTDLDTAYGAGYAGTEDRMFLQDALRHVGAARMSEFLGASPANLAMDRGQLLAAGYNDEEAQAQIDSMSEKFGAEGQLFEDGIQAYVDGINAAQDAAIRDVTKLPGEYAALQILPTPWTPKDIVYIASLVGGIFGKGGGREYANAIWLQRLQAKFGAVEGRKMYDDFRMKDDPEAPVTIPDRFPAQQLPTPQAAAIVLPDVDGPTAPGTGGVVTTLPPELAIPTKVDGPFGPIHLNLKQGNSNALLVSAAESATGHPLAVFGPQTSYYAPQLLVEIDLHGPNIDARGVSFAGTNAVVQLGHGRDFAWSATSSGNDVVDQIAEELCNADGSEPTLESTGYMYNGQCVEMLIRDHEQMAKPSAGGQGTPILVTMELQRTVHGNVAFRTMAKGKPVAIVNQRSTFNGELDSGIGFLRAMNPNFVKDAASFQKAFHGVGYTFNWFYADDKDIAYFNSAKMPRRAAGVDPDFPTWGTGQYDWKGELPFEAHPRSINPAPGYIANWNNKQAPDFDSSDGEWAYGPVYRSLNLSRRIEAGIAGPKKMTRAQLVGVMAEAAHVDTRGAELLPLVLDVLGNDAQTAEARAVLKAWVDDGALREDNDRTAGYSHQPAIAIFDAWYETLARDILRGTLGDLVDQLPAGIDDHPRQGIGSSWNGVAWYGYLSKDLRQILGRPVQGRWHRTYCGGGVLATCRNQLSASLATVVENIRTDQGENMETWTYDKTQDSIRHSAVGVVGVRPIDWQNRPTFQQVVDIRTHRVRPAAPHGDPVIRPRPSDRPLPATGWGMVGPTTALLLSAVGALTYRRSRRKAMSAP